MHAEGPSVGPATLHHPVFSVSGMTGKVLALPPLLYDPEKHRGPLWL